MPTLVWAPLVLFGQRLVWWLVIMYYSSFRIAAFCHRTTQHIEVRTVKSRKVPFTAIYTPPHTIKAPWNDHTDADTGIP